jgi:hypothetical protein
MNEVQFSCNEDKRIYKFWLSLPFDSGSSIGHVDVPRGSVILSVGVEEIVDQLQDTKQNKIMLFVLAPAYYKEYDRKNFQFIKSGDIIPSSNKYFRFIGTVASSLGTRHIFEVIG